MINELKTWYAKNDTTKTAGWIFGMGFDDAVLKEQRFPTKEEKDVFGYQKRFKYDIVG